MNPGRLLRTGFVLSAICLLGFGIYHQRRSMRGDRAAAYASDLRRLQVLDARLNEELLRSRSGLVSHYDGLARTTRELRGLLGQLRATAPDFLTAPARTELRAQADTLAQLLRRKESSIEHFKSHHAVLRNSRRVVPLAARPLLDAPNPELPRKVGHALGALALPGLPAAHDAEPALSAAIGALRSEPAGRAEQVEDRAVFLRHASVVQAREPVVDQLVSDALALPTRHATRVLENTYSIALQAALISETRREKVLFGLAIAMVALGLSDVLYRVRRGAQALLRATTELKAANLALSREKEKERELGDLKTRFVAMTSHEFRNPLSAMLSSSELLLGYGERWTPERRLEHLHRIRGAARSMGQLLDEILLIGRGEAGTLHPTPAPVNLEEQAHEILETLKQSLEQPRSIVCTLCGDPNVVLDERLLRHLLWNLLENAVKYSPPESEVQLSIDAEPHRIHVTVRDSGIGIPEQDMPFLFTSFYRGGNVGQRAGSGLGLAVVKRVVDAQGGDIRVKTELGRGTEVAVVLPHEAGLERA